jgi:hypothetical protein
MKTQTIRTSEMISPPSFGQLANQTTYNLTCGARHQSVAVTNDRKEVTMKSKHMIFVVVAAALFSVLPHASAQQSDSAPQAPGVGAAQLVAPTLPIVMNSDTNIQPIRPNVVGEAPLGFIVRITTHTNVINGPFRTLQCLYRTFVITADDNTGKITNVVEDLDAFQLVNGPCPGSAF